MRCLLDTNILLCAADTTHAQYSVANRSVSQLLATGDELCIVPQNLVEFWVVATRPVTANGIGWSPAFVGHQLLKLKSLFQLLPDTPMIYEEWERLALAYGVIGKPAYDARLVAAMKTHDLTHILTFNVRDFNRFASGESIAIIDPTTFATLSQL